MSKKKKKEKVVYIDDGSTVADMSGTRKPNQQYKRVSTAKEKWATFFGVMKKMIIPMLATLAAFSLVYLIVLLLAQM